MNLKSRKLLCAFVCFICATGSVVLQTATFQEWADFTKWIFGLYAAGNVGEHVAKKTGKK
jgi:hypothetical protein